MTIKLVHEQNICTINGFRDNQSSSLCASCNLKLKHDRQEPKLCSTTFRVNPTPNLIENPIKSVGELMHTDGTDKIRSTNTLSKEPTKMTKSCSPYETTAFSINLPMLNVIELRLVIWKKKYVNRQTNETNVSAFGRLLLLIFHFSCLMIIAVRIKPPESFIVGWVGG